MKIDEFPDPRSATEEGLVAVGGDLSVERLLSAYQKGIFPWTDRPITWWSPNPRAIFEIQPLRLSKRLERLARDHSFEITMDQAFEEVIRACAEVSPRRNESWISSRFIKGYSEFHQAGYAHSVEVWRKKKLVGGVYGVAIGGFFAGESMFYREPNASKVGLLTLFKYLEKKGFVLFDTQVLNPFTAQMGAIEISRDDYLKRLTKAVKLKISFSNAKTGINQFDLDTCFLCFDKKQN